MTILVAGTFNRIHPGHEKLIDAAYYLAYRDVVISMASDEYVNKYKKHVIPFVVREMNMQNYLHKEFGEDWQLAFSISSFDSPFDGVDDEEIETIVCSQETLMNVLAFNKMRAIRDIPEVNIYCLPLTLNDFGKKLSSTELIENGVQS